MRRVLALLLLSGACSSADLGEVTPGLYSLQISPNLDNCTPPRPADNLASFVSVLSCAEAAARGLDVTQAECDTCDGAACSAAGAMCDRFGCVEGTIRVRGLVFGVPLGRELMEVDVGPDGERAFDMPLAQCDSAILRRRIRVSSASDERLRVTLSDAYSGVQACGGGGEQFVPAADCESVAGLTFSLRTACADPCTVEPATINDGFECVCP